MTGMGDDEDTAEVRPPDEPQQLWDEDGRPIIVTTELGEKLFRERFEEMRRIKPDLKEPKFSRRD